MPDSRWIDRYIRSPMPWKEKTIEKLYWSIGEVAEQLGVNTSLIRYWEKEFGSIRPKRTNRGDRSYTRKEIEHLRTIQHLVKEKGFTIQGAREQLRRGEHALHAPKDKDLAAIRDSLLRLRSKALELSKELS